MRSSVFLIMGILLGVITGIIKQPFLLAGANAVSTLFINFLQLITAPTIFLSIFTAFLRMKGFAEMKSLGSKVIFYTLLTTLLATLTALVLFLVIDPVQGISLSGAHAPVSAPAETYSSFLLKIIPSNFVKAFLENHVIGIAFIAFTAGFASLKLPLEKKETLSQFFDALFELMLKITGYVVVFMPIGIWAFTTHLTLGAIEGNSSFLQIGRYLGVVVGANVIQGVIIIPILLKIKGISPLQLFKQSSKILALAFFTKSSNSALPLSLQTAESKMGIHPKIAKFSLPLCTVINMNGCAAFILSTVLFVSTLHGIHFSFVEYGLWVFFATLAAVGNAGVPMGCFFLSSALLLSMNVPLEMMGLILPFYALIDMIETALNVWSDISVTKIVDQKLHHQFGEAVHTVA